jgi:uncharacterized protein
MSKTTPADNAATLSDAEFEQLNELCGVHSPFDIDGLIGMFHALAVGPGEVLQADWLAVLFPKLDLKSKEAEAIVDFSVRLHDEVVSAVAVGEHLIPLPEEFDQCESFAAGYSAGVRLDSKWTSNEDAMALAQAVTYLGGRADLLDDETVALIEREFAPDPKAGICEELMGIVAATYETFRGPWKPPTVQRTAPKVGRNDPCPCGSGKKHKQCCMDS